MHSLSRLAMYKLPFNVIDELPDCIRPCYSYTWEFWRDKAYRDFYTYAPKEMAYFYFDFIQRESGEERYIELWSKMEITSYSLRIYEPLGAIYQALLLNQKNIIGFLYNKLTETQIETLRDRRLNIADELYQPTPWGKDISFFRTAALRKLIKLLFHTRHHREETIKLLGVKSWHIITEKIASEHLPISRLEEFGKEERKEALSYLISLGDRQATSMHKNEIAELCFHSEITIDLSFREKEAALYSNDPSVIHYVSPHLFLYMKTSYFVKKKCLNSFQLASCSNNYLYAEARDVDINKLLFQNKDHDKSVLAYIFIEQSAGNLNVIKDYFSYIRDEDKQELLQKLDNYPVSLNKIHHLINENAKG